MLQCPSCDNTLDQDFGMVTCSQCKAVLMIDISGHVQMGSGVSESESEDTFNDEDKTLDPLGASDFQGGADDDGYDNETDAIMEEEDHLVDDGFFPAENEEFYSAEENSESDEQFSEENPNEGVVEPLEAQEEDVESFYDSIEDGEYEGDSFEEETEEEEATQSFPMASEPDSKPVDITEYANSEESNLEGGELLYDVYLSRIDSKDLKEILKFVLLDEKLKLNHHEYLKKIKDGEVTISNLNPVKAKRIVEQLQYSEIEVQWRQKRVVMAVVEPEEEVDANP